MDRGIINNCLNCGAAYGQYDDKDSYSEYWCEIGKPDKPTKGLCQFCNPKTKYYNKQNGTLNS